MGTLIYCGPGSPESHLATNTPESTFHPMWELVITCYDRGSTEMEEVPKSSYVIVFSEQDIQDEAHLEHLLYPVCMYVCMYVTEWKHHTA